MAALADVFIGRCFYYLIRTSVGLSSSSEKEKFGRIVVEALSIFCT